MLIYRGAELGNTIPERNHSDFDTASNDQHETDQQNRGIEIEQQGRDNEQGAPTCDCV